MDQYPNLIRYKLEHEVSRGEQDEFALRSHKRAAAALDAGKFKDEIVPITVSFEGLDEKGRKLLIGNYIIYTEFFNPQGKKKQFKNVVILARRLN